VAPLPAREPGLPPPRPRGAAGAVRALTHPGEGWPGRTWLPLLALAAAGALGLAADAHVKGPGAVDDVARALLAAVALFAVSGYALARLLLPPSLAPCWPPFVLPLGAAASGLVLTVLGFAAVPYRAALAVTLALALVAAVVAHRHAAPVPAVDRRQLLALAAACALIFAVALIPTFRSGFPTVTGTGSDAHQVAGAATFIQHNYPSSTDVDYPVDEVRAIWNSKYPIFYPLAAASSLAGLEPWEMMMTVGGLLLALTAIGLFLVARRVLGASAGVAAIAMGIAVLDQQVFHVAVHPYYNQMWGLFTLPFSIVLGLWLLDRRERRAQGEPVERLDPRGLWRGWRSALWMVPLGLALLLPIRGVAQKTGDALQLLVDPSQSLEDWGGDIVGYPPFPEFFALPDVPVAGALGAAALIALAGLLFWRLPRRIGLPLAATLGTALAAAGWFALVGSGQYFYFKILSFSGALIVTAAVVAVSRLPWRPAAVAGIVLLAVTAPLGASEELDGAFDQLPRETLELREWSERLPEGASVRIDTPDQIWRAYMLSDRPLGSTKPVRSFPHPPFSLGGDYALRETSQSRPPDAATDEPLFANESLELWKLTGRLPDGTPLRDTSSRRLERFAFDRGLE
jgi:hypothetical protein